MTGTNSNNIERVGYSVKEFAFAAGCSERHVKNQIADGKIPIVKLGTRNIIPASWVKTTFAASQASDENGKAAAA